MDIIEREILFNRLRPWILQAGKLIRDKINDPRIVSTKSNPNDLVTEMDKEVERFFARKIKEFYPDHLLLGEEGYGHTQIDQLETIWIIDPIDGTMNFDLDEKDDKVTKYLIDGGLAKITFVTGRMAGQKYE